MKFYVLLLSLFAALAFPSCGGSCSSTEYAAELAAQSTKVSDAASAYSADPTNNTLCMDYVTEFEALIAVYEKYQDCDDLNAGGVIDAAITSTQTSIDQLDCN